MRRAAPDAIPDQGGFTLVELVVVIVVIGIIAGVLGAFVGSPVIGFIDQARRAEMTATADVALLRLGRDLRLALPNSIRTAGSAVELLLTADGERYRAEGPGEDDDRLDAGVADGAFNTLSALGGSGAGTLSGFQLAVYPLGLPGSDPYVAADGVMTPIGTRFTLSTAIVAGAAESRVTLQDAAGNPTTHRFPLHSPSRRIYLVEGPVSYLHAGSGLYRYSGYAAPAVQASSKGALDALAEPVLMADGVESFSVRYSASGSARRNAVASLYITLEDSGERVRLLRQVHVNNSP